MFYVCTRYDGRDTVLISISLPLGRRSDGRENWEAREMGESEREIIFRIVIVLVRALALSQISPASFNENVSFTSQMKVPAASTADEFNREE